MTHLGDLGDNLKKKIEAHNKRLEETAEAEVQKLKTQLETYSQELLRNFSQELKNWLLLERAIITRDMKDNNQKLKRYLGKQWIWRSVGAGSVCLGILGGSWGLIGFLSQRMIAKQTQLDQIEQKIEQQQQTLNQLQNKTKGITIYETDNGTFIIPPSYQQVNPGWECQGQPCYKVE